MAKPLSEYNRKRNFEITSEPSGQESRGRATRTKGALQFVIQKHDARRLHYDFRLELDGTLKSWAVPKGPSLDPKVKRLAVHVEDHPLGYATFEGSIPEGQYGAGDVIVWDRGTWLPEDADPSAAYRAGRLKFSLVGEKLSGGWALVRTHLRGSGDKEQWLLIKEQDELARPEAEYNIVEAQPDSVLSDASIAAKSARAGTAVKKPKAPVRRSERSTPKTALENARKAPIPASLKPELATLVAEPPSGDWRYEVKFDGYRILARVEGDDVRLFTRNGHDWSAKLGPQVKAIAALGLESAWLDGEITVANEQGLPDFQALQNAFEIKRSQQILFYLFDIPYCNGLDLRETPLEQRRALLRTLLKDTKKGLLRYSDDFAAEHQDILESACQLALEGVIGKRVGSPYVSRRSSDWIKLKCKQRQEFVIGGYSAPKGSRSGFGALLLGVHDDQGGLRYSGRVGTGFNETSLKALHKRMGELERDTAPFSTPPTGSEARGVRWLEPVLVCEVEFAEWTKEGIVRQAVFHGLRADKPAEAITRERAVEPPAEPKPARRRSGGKQEVAGIAISNPERIIDPVSGTTKKGLAEFYLSISEWVLPELIGRPLSLLRAPEGVEGEQFFQRHSDKLEIPHIRQLPPELDSDNEPLMEIDSLEGLIGATQMGAIELHTWNCNSKRIERPDRIIFDLDPDPVLPWKSMVEATHLTLALLDELGLKTFLKTSGGKGIHLVVPLARRHDWEQVKSFAKGVTQHMAKVLPERFAGKMGPKNRIGKIFIDYLRNQRGASTVAAFSVRARPGLPVSVPIALDELERIKGANQWTLDNLEERLSTLKKNPWAGYANDQSITLAMRRKLGLA